MRYSKEIYSIVKNIINVRKKMAREEYNRRLDEIATRIPRIIEIQNEMSRTGSKLAKIVLTKQINPTDILEAIKKENLTLQEEKSRLLSQNNLALDYLDIPYSCKICSDAGYTDTIGDARCICLKELLKQENFEMVRKSSNIVRSTFSSFDVNKYKNIDIEGVTFNVYDQMSRIYRLCKEYAQHFKNDSNSILMIGNTGLGKTHLSLAIANVVINSGYYVVYFSTQKLMDTLENEKFSRVTSSNQTLSDVLNCDLLILDDLGAEFTTQFTNSVIYDIINSRLIENKSTIINTNLDENKIEARYAQRTYSRVLFGYKVLKFYGKDIRYINSQQGLR